MKSFRYAFNFNGAILQIINFILIVEEMSRLHLVLRSLRWTLLLQLQALQSHLIELVIQLILTFDFCFRKYIALFVFDVWAFKVLVHLRWVLIKLLLGFLTYYVLSVIALNCSSCSRWEVIIISLTHLLLIIIYIDFYFLSFYSAKRAVSSRL